MSEGAAAPKKACVACISKEFVMKELNIETLLRTGK